MKKLNWGNGIFLAVTVFVIATLSVVSYLISLDFYMVSSDHYQEAVDYQETIDSKKNAAKLKEPVVVLFDEKTLSVDLYFPPVAAAAVDSGTVYFYRPNDSKLDKKIMLSLNREGKQRISVADFTKGKWVLSIEWKADSLNYLEKKSIII